MTRPFPNTKWTWMCRGTVALGLSSWLLASAPGCSAKLPRWRSGAWSKDYETAESRANAQGAGMVIFYRDTPPLQPDPMLDATREAVANGGFGDYTGCILSKSHAPDRCYVAQFGVDRAPAIVVLHPDGTYHASVGWLPADRVARFLSGATPPGRRPAWDPYLYRTPRFTWVGSVEEGRAIATETSRPMLVVFYRWWSNDLSELNRMLRTPTLYRRLTDMVHVRQTSVWNFSETMETQYGTLRLPAVVIVEPGGGFRVLEIPGSAEAIVRFADQRGSHDEPEAGDSATATAILGSE